MFIFPLSPPVTATLYRIHIFAVPQLMRLNIIDLPACCFYGGQKVYCRNNKQDYLPLL